MNFKKIPPMKFKDPLHAGCLQTHKEENAMPLQKLYSVEEIAQITSVTTRTIRNYLRNGILKGRKIGGQWRFSLEDIETMMNQTNGAFQENSRRIVGDFIDSVYTPFPQSISVCTIADVPCTQEKAAQISKTLCALWNQPASRGTFRYDYLEDAQTARYTLIAPIELVQTALALLQQEAEA